VALCLAKTPSLDYVIVLNEEHLRRLLREFLAYYHDDRTHLSLGKDPPERRAVSPRPSPTSEVVSLPRVGGLHHRYEWAEAAWSGADGVLARHRLGHHLL